jgi:competence transcription factor ComK
VTINSSAAAQTWQRGLYKKVNHKMKLRNEEFDQEIGYLKSTVERLQNLRKQLLTEKHD